SGWTRWKAGPHALKPAPPFSRTLVMHAATPEPGVAGTKKGTQVRFFSNGHQIRMDKGPNGTIEKFPARKNNDFMIKVLKHRTTLSYRTLDPSGRDQQWPYRHWAISCTIYRNSA